MITQEEVLKLAKLANLTIRECELEHLIQDMEEILSFAHLVVSAASTEEIYEPLHKGNLRNDEIHPSYPQEEILKNAAHDDRFFLVNDCHLMEES